MITVKDLELSFGVQPIFNGVTFNINKGDKIGLVGRNGSGKTTLFSLLNKEVTPDKGLVSIPKHYSIGYVKQHLEFSENTVLGEGCLGLKPDERYNEWIVERLLIGLGFTEDDFYRDPLELSGGFQIRLNLVKSLAFEPNMLLLDEPTNYLDIASVRWLIGFLKSWPDELMIISHDRHFMDSITNHTIAIHRQGIKKIKGSSIDVYSKIEEEEEIYEKTRMNQEKKEKKTRVFIDTFRSKASIAKLVQSRIKALEKSQKLEKKDQIRNLEFKFNEAEFQAKTLMQVSDLSFSYAEKLPLLVRRFNLSVEKLDRICVIGKNGIGKSTLLKLLYGILTPNTGNIKLHPNTKIGYFGQTNIATLNPELTIEDELFSCNLNANKETIRRICGSMMFSGDDALKKVSFLSGGEKSRVLLGKILLTPANLLLLDEPTHHLDMESCDSLVEAIEVFKGASIIVTHDENFLHLLATKLIVFDEKGVSVFLGSYQDFLDRNKW
ncbi:MAG: ABC-F family ATP-binding cassette domain-containing protein [Candidatus Margulisiibacteriota bacterium]|jgi:ATP-binding cassette subfamily F protein 3